MSETVNKNELRARRFIRGFMLLAIVMMIAGPFYAKIAFREPMGFCGFVEFDPSVKTERSLEDTITMITVYIGIASAVIALTLTLILQKTGWKDSYKLQ